MSDIFAIDRKVPVSGDENWWRRVLALWREDECTLRDPDAEHLDGNEPGHLHEVGAWERFTGDPLDTDERVLTADLGDTFMHLHPRGWVELVSCEGGAVGVLLKERRGDEGQ